MLYCHASIARSDNWVQGIHNLVLQYLKEFHCGFTVIKLFVAKIFQCPEGHCNRVA